MDVFLRVFAEVNQQFVCTIHRAVQIVIQSLVVQQQTQIVVFGIQFVRRHLQVGQGGIDRLDSRVQIQILQVAADGREYGGLFACLPAALHDGFDRTHYGPV